MRSNFERRLLSTLDDLHEKYNAAVSAIGNEQSAAFNVEIERLTAAHLSETEALIDEFNGERRLRMVAIRDMLGQVLQLELVLREDASWQARSRRTHRVANAAMTLLEVLSVSDGVNVTSSKVLARTIPLGPLVEALVAATNDVPVGEAAAPEGQVVAAAAQHVPAEALSRGVLSGPSLLSALNAIAAAAPRLSLIPADVTERLLKDKEALRQANQKDYWVPGTAWLAVSVRSRELFWSWYSTAMVSLHLRSPAALRREDPRDDAGLVANAVYVLVFDM